MSLQMKLVAAYLRRTRHPLLASPEKLRRALEQPRTSAPVPHELYQVNHVVSDEVTTPARTFAVHSLVPATDAPRDTPLDICVYLHGGAYVSGLDVRHWSLISDLAATGTRVIVPDYGLAPEHDAEDALSLLDTVIGDAAAEAERSGHRLRLAGDSAGGGLALGWMLTTGHRDAASAVDRIGLISPWLDVTCSTPGLDALVADDPWLHPAGLRVAGEAWAGGRSLQDPLVSPLAATDSVLASLPQVRVWTGTRDILHADALALDGRLTGCKIRTTPGAVHVHPLTPTPEGRAARQEVIAWLSGGTDSD